MKFSIPCLYFALIFSIYAQSTNALFNAPFPNGWTILKQAQNKFPDGTIGFVTVLGNSAKKARVQIETVQKNEIFDSASESWKKSALNMAPKSGFLLSDVKYEIISYHSGKQAVLSFQASKGNVSMFVSSRFWLEHGKEIAVAASSSNDIRQDEAVLKIFDSITP